MRNSVVIRIFAPLVLVMAMVLSLAPVTAWAEEGDPSYLDSDGPIQDEAYASELAQYPRSGYVESSFPALSVHDANDDDELVPEASLPSRYSSVEKGRVTPVREQGMYGACWIFAVVAPMESYVLTHQADLGLSYTPQTLDLSERHLAYFTFHLGTDPLGNTRGDSTSLDADYLQAGGAFPWAINALASWAGPAPEDKAPYLPYEPMDDLPASAAYADAEVRLANTRQFAFADRSEVKRAIMEYGALGLAYVDGNNYHSAFKGGDAYYWDGKTRSGDRDLGGHSVTLVGWDDNFAVSNFGNSGYEVRPKNKGAWLIKNSWGTGFGNEGYGWISYEDAAFSMTGTGRDQAWAYGVVSASKYQDVYQYDGSIGAQAAYTTSGGAIANVFKACSSTRRETVAAVSFQLADVNVSYSIQVYLNPTDPADPESGIALLAEPQQGKTRQTGMYTVDLDQPVAVAHGDWFAVVVTLSHRDGSDVGYVLDSTYEGGACSFVNSVSPGQSFVRVDGAWYDLATEAGASARLKAYTRGGGGFSDVSVAHWAYRTILRAADLGIIHGFPDGTFGPDGKVTRAQAVTMIWNMAGSPKASGSARTFSDVAADAYYYRSVSWASSAGVVHGYGGTDLFGPNDEVTREQFATMIANYASLQAGRAVSGSRADYEHMDDAAEVSSYAERTMGWCYRNKILVGSSGLLRPKGTTTRAQACKMVVMLHDLLYA